MEFYSLSGEEAMRAIRYYREYFKDRGIYENKVYRGMSELLRKLKEKGCVIVVATSKPTVFANIVIGHFKLTEYFDMVVGSNLDGTRSSKAEIISYVIDRLKIENPEDVVMIGDRKFDVIGARENSIDSIGVLYGYGSLEELENAKPTHIAKSIDTVHQILIRT